MVGSGEVVTVETNSHDSQENYSDKNVSSVKSSSHVESSTEDTVSNGELSQAVLVKLKHKEEGTQDNGGYHTSKSRVLVTSDHSVVSHSTGGSRRQEEHATQKWKRPRVNGRNTNWRPNSTQLDARSKSSVEESPEEGEEDHNLRQDEENYTHHKSALDLSGVLSREALTSNVTEPSNDYKEKGEKTHHQKVGTSLEGVNKTNSKDKGRDTGEKWPWAGVYQVVTVAIRSQVHLLNIKKGGEWTLAIRLPPNN